MKIIQNMKKETQRQKIPKHAQFKGFFFKAKNKMGLGTGAYSEIQI